MGRWLVIFAATLLLGSTGARAQDIQVRGSVNHTTVGSEELLVYSLEVEGASLSTVDTPEPPETEGLALVQRTPSVQRNMTLINGRLQQSVIFRWSYRALREGSARIGSASVTVDDRTYATDPVEVTVLDQPRSGRSTAQRQQWPFVNPSQPNPEEEDVSPPDAQDLFIRAVPSSRTVRQNEQVTIEYRLYFRDGVQLRHSRLAGSWDAEGFWREEFNVDTRPVPTTVIENGLRYRMIVLKRVAVFPTRAGTLTVEPLEIETEAYLPSTSGDAFERFFSPRGRFETVDLASAPVVLRVEPLPEDPPASFTGAVGRFQVSAAASRTEAEVGEPVQVTITVRGTGNIATLAAPSFDPPGIFERYDPSVSLSVERDGRWIGGTKTFEHVLIPRSNGSFDLPPVSFTYFDPQAGRYVTDMAELPVVRVTGTPAPPAASTTPDGLPIDDVAPILTNAETWTAVDPTPFHVRVWPYAALALPALLVLGLYMHRRRADRLEQDTQYARSRMAHPLARKHLQEARRLLEDAQPRAFYEEIERAVTGFIGNRLNVAETGHTRNELDARLEQTGVSADDRQLLRRLLEECDQARFAPILPGREQMQSAGERAARVIVAVDEAAAAHESTAAAA